MSMIGQFFFSEKIIEKKNMLKQKCVL